MGMFDEIRSSYDLGEQFTNVLCQTKDIDDWGSGTMTLYWISPSGELWKPEYTGTHDFKVYSEGDLEYDPLKKWVNWEWIPTGKHGRYTPHKITKFVEIYPALWEGKWENWPICRLHFVDGILKDYQHKNCTSEL